jgi:hypothetical protein
MVSIAQKIVRAGLVGMTVGIIAGLGFFFMMTAVNNIVGTPIVPPMDMFLLMFSFVLIAAIAIELSGDISSQNGNGKPAGPVPQTIIVYPAGFQPIQTTSQEQTTAGEQSKKP